MNKLTTITFKGKEYPVEFAQTPNYSDTDMNKIGMVNHVTTSNSFKGLKSWFASKRSQASTLFGVGREVGQIIQFGLPGQKLWHAGRISNPNERFLKIAKRNPEGKLINPNLYLDGTEYCGGEDVDTSGKVEEDEVELTEWQFACAEQIPKWHSKVCGYELKPENQLIHQDITDYKPDLDQVRDEIHYRLFSKEERKESYESLVKQIEKQNAIIKLLKDLVIMLLGRLRSLK